ncbi:MAG TPA: ubiquinol-cytochrome c reductase iron-sulfur subunit [Burkholderiales bacterium]|jgi:ubiquinol-cytochrome c reductase iron-sulfur subunit|nr:ubiquinol-cytochrome c reductase iron-sulfur subunit [Burkholderiales bacterium]
MSDNQKIDKTRRNLVVATTAAGGAAAVGVAVPFVASMMPSERAKAAGAPIEVDISTIAPGELRVFEWRGKPVWVIRRTQEMLESLKKVAGNLTDPASKSSQQPEYAKNEYRSLKPEVVVMEGVCTHLGCSPQMKPADAKAEMGGDWAGGFYCACHGSKFDLAGRVFRGAPAPTNLVVPPYTFLSDSKLLIGEDKKGA